MKKELLNRIKRILILLSPLPFMLGVVGYYESGQSLSDSIYYSISLYGFNWDSIANNIWIEIARWTAPVVTATGLIAIIQKAYEYMYSNMVCILFRDATAIYSNIEAGKLLKENIPHSILSEKMEIRKAKNHIVLFQNDKENMFFYEKNKEYLKNKNVYLCLNDINLNSLRKEFSNVRIFKASDVIARRLWKEICIWKRRNEQNTYKIVIIGFGGLGQSILNYGLQINLFSINQSIEYHIIGESEAYQKSHKNLNMMNLDGLVFHDCDESVWEICVDADYIIITDDVSYDYLESMHYAYEKTQIFYYSPEIETIAGYVDFDNVFPYGDDANVYTEENIKTNKLYELAMKENYNYLLHNVHSEKILGTMEDEWDKLDGFTKGSNISSSDYECVIKEIYKCENDVSQITEELAELEHIRWARYHYLNHWKYGVPESGKNKDSEKRTHKCLCPYLELPEVDKEKDRQVILGWCSEIQ